ncbi:MAG: hypothetical protein FWD47_07350 [Treponema sp.]|nr:hypothetical protein [Treponema sp.]
MTITQTVEIPADYRIFLDLPRSVPTGVKAQVSIAIPTVFENQNVIDPQVKSFRGILKGKGISIERLREMQNEDKILEDTIDNRRSNELRKLI